jgi:VanZ family protein
MLLIVFVSHIPQKDIHRSISGPDNIDLLFHFVEYSILGFLLFQSISTDDFFTINPLYGSVVIGIFFAISDEFHQSFVPGRHMSSMDMLFDSVGIVFGTFSSRFFNYPS